MQEAPLPGEEGPASVRLQSAAEGRPAGLRECGHGRAWFEHLWPVVVWQQDAGQGDVQQGLERVGMHAPGSMSSGHQG